MINNRHKNKLCIWNGLRNRGRAKESDPQKKETKRIKREKHEKLSIYSIEDGYSQLYIDMYTCLHTHFEP